ncbi:MAG: T9SS type A sorting domain-containing protein [Tannerellaceae bacterium]|nr:T9SS type A sorting domain-containing protein [Tannerellaceae bacterium]
MNKYLLILSGLLVFSGATLNAQAVYNKGKLYVGSSSTNANLYIKGHLRMTGSGYIAHEGKTVLTGDLINDVTANTVFSTRNGSFEFRGDNAQQIRGTANKATSYVTFPNTVIINNKNSNAANTTVTIDPSKGITVKNLTFTRGRLVVESTARMEGTQRVTDIAHLYAETGGTIVYKHGQSDPVNEGAVQVNLAMGDNWNNGRMVGFSSPFKNIYADYFFFNFLAKPDTTGLYARTNDFWIKDPKVSLPAGRGYFMGQGLVPWGDSYYMETLNPAYASAQYADAAKDIFIFARRFAPASFTSFVAAAYGNTVPFEGEELNTGNVTVALSQGYNFLGNPFLTPLDLKELFGTPSTSTWGAAVTDLERTVYKLTSGHAEYLPNREFEFGTTYLNAQAVGATTSDTIAPMQMFVVRKTTAGNANFIIPASKRVQASFPHLRSETAPVVDELLIETQDGLTGDFDRLCVVFRNGASLLANDRYDAVKLFNHTGGVNQIYTRSSDNRNLITNVIPSNTKSMVMYLEPSARPQEVTLRASRIQSISSVPQVVLEDRQTGKVTNLKQTSVYRFQSSPSDRTDRFVLYFRDAPTAVDEIYSPVFRAGYESGGIGVYGLKDSWIGRDALVYDMLGQLLYRSKVIQAPSMRIERSLSKGIYMVKIAGENTVAAKFLVK